MSHYVKKPNTILTKSYYRLLNLLSGRLILLVHTLDVCCVTCVAWWSKDVAEPPHFAEIIIIIIII